uniref:Uncharacterized protein n=1 Tax=Rhizophora mucronata TaxID=61149 RepID=A0A2P2QTJ6_RHIMU
MIETNLVMNYCYYFFFFNRK